MKSQDANLFTRDLGRSLNTLLFVVGCLLARWQSFRRVSGRLGRCRRGCEKHPMVWECRWRLSCLRGQNAGVSGASPHHLSLEEV